MESVARFSNIPVVESGIKTVGTVYKKVKRSNGLFNWGFESAEAMTYALIDSLRPAAKLIEGPLHRLDEFMCKSLDFVEQKVPSMYLPPEMMYWNTKEYMTDHLVKPVLSRANSMKSLVNVVLELPVSNYAADRLDGALNVCDKYVDRFLPAEPVEDQPDCTTKPRTVKQEPDDSNEAHVIQTFHLGKRISRKLTRRLTFRTRQELTALKKQSTEAVHVFFYVAELIATNPYLAMQKGLELWKHLSADEPENQARPQTLEHLFVLLTRESTRKVVHLVNYLTNAVIKIPKRIHTHTQELLHYLVFATDKIIQTAHLEHVKSAVISNTTEKIRKLQRSYDELQIHANLALERLAVFLSGRLEAEKITTSDNPHRRIQNRTNHNPVHSSINGVY